MQTDNSLVQRFFDLAFNQGDLGIIDELVAADGAISSVSWGSSTSRTGLKQLIAAFRIAFPDLHSTVEDEIREGGKLAACWTMRGTHLGAYQGNPPTGRPVVVQGMLYAHTENGRIVAGWILVDQIGILQQLGIVPPTRN
ncbi:MAG TPA: ester cyclase [Anaerolineales bacterium]